MTPMPKRQWAYDRNSPLRQTEQGARGSPSERLNGSRYEERLEDYLSMNSPFRDEDGCAHRRRHGSLYDRFRQLRKDRASRLRKQRSFPIADERSSRLFADAPGRQGEWVKSTVTAHLRSAESKKSPLRGDPPPDGRARLCWRLGQNGKRSATREIEAANRAAFNLSQG